MKGLRKYLSPFTPDQSGAVSVLFHYGGMLIIMDAGGCVGNICGYDEPRWDKKKSAIFSAALRDLDAILGRDELLIQKTKEALGDIDAKFVGLIGTPVPAVIATDASWRPTTRCQLCLSRLMESTCMTKVLARRFCRYSRTTCMKKVDQEQGSSQMAVLSKKPLAWKN